MVPHPDCIVSSFSVPQLWQLLLLDCSRNWQFDSFLLFTTRHSISQKLLRCLRQLWLSATHTHSQPQVLTHTHIDAHTFTLKQSLCRTLIANSESHLAFCGFCGPDRRPLRVDIDIRIRIHIHIRATLSGFKWGMTCPMGHYIDFVYGIHWFAWRNNEGIEIAWDIEGSFT